VLAVCCGVLLQHHCCRCLHPLPGGHLRGDHWPDVPRVLWRLCAGGWAILPRGGNCSNRHALSRGHVQRDWRGSILYPVVCGLPQLLLLLLLLLLLSFSQW
jgi:hypothetical protein